MGYVTPAEVREFCGLTESECPDEVAQKAIAYAQGLIDDYCRTRFENPGQDATYYYDGDGSTTIFAPDDGPWAIVTAIEYRDGDSWEEYDGDYWVKAGGEWIELQDSLVEGNLNWRVTGRCWTQLNENRAQMLKRACLMICRLALVPRDEPLGPSVRSISVEGISYTYQQVDQAHPTGINEVDYLLRALRRSVIVP